LSSRAARLRILSWAVGGLIFFTVLVTLPGHLPTKYFTAAYDRLIWGMKLDTLGKDDSVQWRITESRYAIQSIVQHPFLGIGLGNLYRPEVFGDETQYNHEFPQYGARWYIHNAYLWVLIDTGLIGFVPFIWLFWTFLLRGFTRWRKIEDPKLRVVVLGFSLGILGQAISNLVAPNFIQSWVLVVFAIMLGVNEVIYRWELERGHLAANLGHEGFGGYKAGD
jgi:O-antigen ligase